MPTTDAPQGTRSAASNRRFYDALWSASDLVLAAALQHLAAAVRARGVGAGATRDRPGSASAAPHRGHALRRRQPTRRSRASKAHGGLATLGEITALPFPDRTLRSGLRLRHRRARRGRPAGLSRARPGRQGRCDGRLLGTPASRALERVRRPRRSLFDATIPTTPRHPGASTPSRSSRARPSACSRGAAGSSTSPCGA